MWSPVSNETLGIPNLRLAPIGPPSIRCRAAPSGIVVRTSSTVTAISQPSFSIRPRSRGGSPAGVALACCPLMAKVYLVAVADGARQAGARAMHWGSALLTPTAMWLAHEAGVHPVHDCPEVVGRRRRIGVREAGLVRHHMCGAIGRRVGINAHR